MKIENAKCPECGDRVFVPMEGLRELYGGDKSKDDPIVYCSDFGHWVGWLSDCKGKDGD